MNFSLTILFASALSLGFVAAQAKEPFAYQAPAPTREISIFRDVWHDAVRNRDVPVKVYYPQTGAGPFPIIIFSHGLGGSREGYEYLGRCWAACGYVCVHVQHAGSDDAVWRDAPFARKLLAMQEAAANSAAIVNRPKDISFAIDKAIALNTDGKSVLNGRLDPEHIGVAGHSFGGFTSMAIAGEDFGLKRFGDPRVKAVIQMSAPVARPALRETAYSKIAVPVFHMTGTRDDSPIGETTAAERRIPFDKMSGAETCLLICKDGDHMVFAGAPRASADAKIRDAEFQKLICSSSTAFWDAWLKGDANAHAWLMNGGFAAQVGSSGTFETKLPAK